MTCLALGLLAEPALATFPENEGNVSPPAVNCMLWGSDAKPAPINSNGSGMSKVPLPGNGQSDQLQADGTSVIAAAPTPKARNATSPGGGMVGTGGGGSAPMTPTTFAGVSFGAR